jgi:GT2 family glycosyltransferase
VKVDTGWLRPLVEVGEQDERAGILSPIHYDYEGRGKDPMFLKLLGKNPDYVRDEISGHLESKYQISWAIGAAFLLRRQVCQEVGLFDPLYFAYFEEMDLCRRVRYHGFDIVAVPTSRIYHFHTGLHEEELKKKSKFVMFRILRNAFIYEFKDPAYSFGRNLARYIRGRGVKKITRLGSMKNPKYLCKIIYIHIWLLLMMPLLAYKHYKEKRQACYLN